MAASFLGVQAHPDSTPMQITKFRGFQIHGYLNFDVNFEHDLTFLTGINGSGKTSVIQSIIALISPSFFVLANLDFESIQVDIEHEGTKLTIEAVKKIENTVELATSATNERLQLKKYVPPAEEPLARTTDRAQDYYREMTTLLATHEVVQIINKLPTPMFLDLDRRATALQERRESGRLVRPGPPSRRPRNIFAFSLSQSLEYATALAEGQYRDTLIAIGRLGDELRRKMILDLLELERGEYFAGPLSLPSPAEITTVRNMRRSVETLPQILQLSKDDVERRLLPTLETLESLITELSKKGSDISSYFPNPNQKRSITADDPAFQAFIRWNANRPQLQKLVKMVDHVRDYSARRELHSERARNYLQILNSFLKDSGKEVLFDPAGYLWFKIHSMEGLRPTSLLSSGEGQLFVIITHLFFNPLAQEANVFIIDEPELSLHVQWQELFVSSVISANPNVQYIMATHSPSIILDRLSHCRDLSKADQRGVRG